MSAELRPKSLPRSLIHYSLFNLYHFMPLGQFLHIYCWFFSFHLRSLYDAIYTLTSSFHSEFELSPGEVLLFTSRFTFVTH